MLWHLTHSMIVSFLTSTLQSYCKSHDVCVFVSKYSGATYDTLYIIFSIKILYYQLRFFTVVSFIYFFTEIKEKNENFGTSLLLSNLPTSPKIVNGSFAAIYDQGDVLVEFSKTIKLRKDAQDSPGK